MSSQIHIDALGYEPRRMKPVHFANGFFLSVCRHYANHLLLNRSVVIKGASSEPNESLIADTQIFDGKRLPNAIANRNLAVLRQHLNGAAVNDDAVYRVTKKTRFCDYTLSSDRMITNFVATDGGAGHFVAAVLSLTREGKAVIAYAKTLMSRPDCSIERLLNPLLDPVDERSDWEPESDDQHTPVPMEQLKSTSKLMLNETTALQTLTRNLAGRFSSYTQLRYLVISLLSWLLAYLHKRSALDTAKQTILLMDFSGERSRRMRLHSRSCYARNREIFALLYMRLAEQKVIDGEDEGFRKLRDKDRFKVLETHYGDLAVKAGLAQPRSIFVARKHYELQPDTARALLLSVVGREDVIPVEEVARRLRSVWGICFGACADDPIFLRDRGYHNLGDDEDLRSNREGFIDFLKAMNLASEPSDGLVLCATDSEVLL